MPRAAAIVLILCLAFGLNLERLCLRPVLVNLTVDLHRLDWRRLTSYTFGHPGPAESQTLSRSPAPETGEAAKTPGAPVTQEATASTNPNSYDANVDADKPGLPVSLDIAQISRDGTSVFAGKSAPFAQVTVLDGKTEVATVTALASGDWSVATEHKFANAEPQIRLKATEHSEKSTAQPAHGGAAVSASEKSIAGAQSGAVAAASPSAQLMKEFEGVVAAAREESKLATAREEAKLAAAREGAKLEKNDVGGIVPVPLTSSVQTLAAVAPSAQSAQANIDAHAPEQIGPDTAQSPTVTTAVPITFIYNEPTLTADGQGAARLLLEYVTLKRFRSISLSGHADERGSQAYNMELSRQRLLTIERVLRAGGYRGQIDLVPKGSSEPFTGVVRSRFPREDLLQLDRRVELRVAK